jgi:hypothetical protein
MQAKPANLSSNYILLAGTNFMKLAINPHAKIYLKRLFVIFSLVSTLILGLPLGNIQAQASPIASQETRDRVDEKPYFTGESSDRENTREKAESAKDEVVDKLNLKEPLPASTKKFFKQIKGEAPIEDTTHPEANY